MQRTSLGWRAWILFPLLGLAGMTGAFSLANFYLAYTDPGTDGGPWFVMFGKMAACAAAVFIVAASVMGRIWRREVRWRAAWVGTLVLFGGVTALLLGVSGYPSLNWW